MENKESAAKAFQTAIVNHNEKKIRSFLSSTSAKELLVATDDRGFASLHVACSPRLPKGLLQLLLDAAVEHRIIERMLEAKTGLGSTCLHLACLRNLSPDSLRVLLEYSLKHADIKKTLDEKDKHGWTCLHHACYNNVSTDSLCLLLEYLVKHADIKEMLEKTCNGWTCLHWACHSKLSTDSLRLLLEYLSKYADIKKMFEEKTTNTGWTCLHLACASGLSIDSLRLLISFFPSNESLQLVLSSKACNQAPLGLAQTEEHQQLLQDLDCWRKCRYWLFCNYRDTFLDSLYPNSPEKTLEALKELNKTYVDDDTVKNAILLQQILVERSRVIPDESAARQALELTVMFTIEEFHRDHIIQLETIEVQQRITDFRRLNPLSEEEVDRQELEKLIFDQLSRDRLMKEAVPILFEHGVTKESFFLLDKDDLREMGVKIGPRKQLLQIIEQETYRRNNLSARTDISSRPRSSGHTPRIGVVPPIALSASGLIQRHQQQLGNAPPLPPASKDSSSDEQQRSFVATANSDTVSVNGGTESYQSGPTAKS